MVNKDGKPVRDLDISEVRIKNNGRLQQIPSFEQSDVICGSNSVRPVAGLPDGYQSNRRVSGPSEKSPTKYCLCDLPANYCAAWCDSSNAVGRSSGIITNSKKNSAWITTKVATGKDDTIM